MMSPEAISQLARTIADLRETVALFQPQFTAMSDDDLRSMITKQKDIAEDAEWTAHAAESELILRRIKLVTG